MNRQEKLILFISAFIILFAGIAYYYLPVIVLNLRPKAGNFIGLAVQIEGDVKMRYGDSVNWKEVKKNERIYTRTYLYTGENSSGFYAFLDKSSISLGQNSLIYLDFTIDEAAAKQGQDSLKIDLVDGKMDIDLKENSKFKQIKVDDAVIDISDQKTRIKLENDEDQGMEISVMQGEIDITKNDKSYNVKPGEKLGVKKQEKPKKSKVSKDMMEEMKKISDEEQARVNEELRKRRQLSYILQEFIDFLKGLISSN
jgi:hypothetical protein